MQTIPVQKSWQGKALCSLQLRSHLTYPPHLRRGKLPNLISAWLFSQEVVRRNECYCCLVLAGRSCSLNKMRESHKYWQSSVLPFSQSWASKQRRVCQLSSQMSVPFRSRFSVFPPMHRNSNCLIAVHRSGYSLLLATLWWPLFTLLETGWIKNRIPFLPVSHPESTMLDIFEGLRKFPLFS